MFRFLHLCHLDTLVTRFSDKGAHLPLPTETLHSVLKGRTLFPLKLAPVTSGTLWWPFLRELHKCDRNRVRFQLESWHCSPRKRAH
jgi:hypothetical protein